MDINRFNKIYSDEKQKQDFQSQYAKKFLADVDVYWVDYVKKLVSSISDKNLDNSIARLMQKSPLADTFELRQYVYGPRIYKTYINYNTSSVLFTESDMWSNSLSRAKCDNIDFSALINYCHLNKYYYDRSEGCVFCLNEKTDALLKQIVPVLESRLKMYGLKIKNTYINSGTIHVVFYNPCK